MVPSSVHRKAAPNTRKNSPSGRRSAPWSKPSRRTITSWKPTTSGASDASPRRMIAIRSSKGSDTLQQLMVSTRRCRRIALLHRLRGRSSWLRSMSLRHSGCGLDLRTFPDAGGDEHEAQAADRAKCTRQLPNGRGQTGIGVPPDEDADGALCQQCLHFMRGVHREDALTGIEHERAQDLGVRKAERGQTYAAPRGAPQPLPPSARPGAPAAPEA